MAGVGENRRTSSASGFPMTATPPSGSRPAIAFLFVIALMDVMASSLAIPVLPSLVQSFTHSTRNAGSSYGLLVAIWAAMQFIFSPVIGALSDTYGRRPVLLISSAGLAVDWVLMALAPNLWWLVVVRLIAGVVSSSMPAAFAYIADITPPEQRARAFGLIGAAWSAGFVVGPALGGALAAWGPRTPFWVASAMTALSFLFGYFMLPESLPHDRRTPFSWRRANPLGALRLLGSHAELKGLATVNFLHSFAYYVIFVVYVLYARNRFSFSLFEIGLLMGLMGVLDIPVQGWLVGKVVARIGDRWTMVAGFTAAGSGLLLMSVAPNRWVFAAALLPLALYTLAIPTIQSLMSARVSEREQGQLQGANTSTGSVAGIVAPIVFGWTYSLTAETMPGSSFALAGFFFLIAAIIGSRFGKASQGVQPA